MTNLGMGGSGGRNRPPDYSEIIEYIEAGFEKLGKEIRRVEGELKNEIAGLRNEIGDVKHRVSSLEKGFGELRSEITNLRNYIQRVEGELKNELLDVKYKMADLEFRIRRFERYSQIVETTREEEEWSPILEPSFKLTGIQGGIDPRGRYLRFVP